MVGTMWKVRDNKKINCRHICAVCDARTVPRLLLRVSESDKNNPRVPENTKTCLTYSAKTARLETSRIFFSVIKSSGIEETNLPLGWDSLVARIFKYKYKCLNFKTLICLDTWQKIQIEMNIFHSFLRSITVFVLGSFKLLFDVVFIIFIRRSVIAAFTQYSGTFLWYCTFCFALQNHDQ